LQRRVAQPAGEAVGVLDRAIVTSSLTPPFSDGAWNARPELTHSHRQRARVIR
jgi:hypothetical protein